MPPRRSSTLKEGEHFETLHEMILIDYCGSADVRFTSLLLCGFLWLLSDSWHYSVTSKLYAGFTFNLRLKRTFHTKHL